MPPLSTDSGAPGGDTFRRACCDRHTGIPLAWTRVAAHPMGLLRQRELSPVLAGASARLLSTPLRLSRYLHRSRAPPERAARPVCWRGAVARGCGPAADPQ